MSHRNQRSSLETSKRVPGLGSLMHSKSRLSSHFETIQMSLVLRKTGDISAQYYGLSMGKNGQTNWSIYQRRYPVDMAYANVSIVFDSLKRGLQ